jgi:hypothetical protein
MMIMRLQNGSDKRGFFIAMPTVELLEKIRSILTREFPSPDEIELEDADGIIGTLTSKRFVGMETIDRINLIWDLLDRELTREERRGVVLIVAATPEEEIAYTA